MITELIFKLRKLFSTKDISLLCVGLERTKRSETLLGAEASARKFYKKIKPRCNHSKLLLNEEATWKNVVAEMTAACQADLAIITFNCHGGQQKGKENETDGKDEFLAIYDEYLLDNHIWRIISKAKGRVFLIFDSCHSGTMYRNITFADCYQFARDFVPDILCWASCAEDKESYSTSTGGMLTKKICKNIRWWKTYDSLWKTVSKDKSLAKSEIVVRSMLREDDSKFKHRFFLS